MSVKPTPPGRSDPNQSVRPSAEIAALVSKESWFSSSIAVGGSNARLGLERRAVQMSVLPLTRSVVKTISSRSAVSVGLSDFVSAISSATGRGTSKW